METKTLIEAIESLGIIGVLAAIIAVVVKWLDKKDTQLEEKNKQVMESFTKNTVALSNQADATRDLAEAVKESSRVSAETLNTVCRNRDVLEDIDNFIKNKHA